MSEEPEGGVVHPLRVVHGEEQGIAAGEVRRQPIQTMKGPRLVAELKPERRASEGGSPGEQARPLGRAHPDNGLEELTDETPWEFPLEDPSTRRKDSHLEARRDIATGFKERGLADPGGPLDHAERAAALTSKLDPLGQPVELGTAFEKPVPPPLHRGVIIGNQ